MKRRSPAYGGRFEASWNGIWRNAFGGFRILDEGKIAAPWSGFQRKPHKLGEAGLDEAFEAEETPERAEAEKTALAFYAGQMIRAAARKPSSPRPNSPKDSGTAKSRVSKIENGTAIPSVAALGFRAESVKAV